MLVKTAIEYELEQTRIKSNPQTMMTKKDD